jgi:hypothetical protein
MIPPMLEQYPAHVKGFPVTSPRMDEMLMIEPLPWGSIAFSAASRHR